MDTLDQRREVIRHILTDLAAISRSKGGWKSEPVFDREHDSYMVLSQGWDGLRRVHHIVAHIQIVDGKIWVQADNTNIEIVGELEEAGVPKSDIVLGFRHPDVRPLTEYAVA